MQSEVHVGIDVSKFTLDVFILEVRSHLRFKNNSNDFPAILQWIEKCTKRQSAFICFEHTGVYSMALAAFLESQHIVCICNGFAFGNQTFHGYCTWKE